jgi:hypothetical protein
MKILKNKKSGIPKSPNQSSSSAVNKKYAKKVAMEINGLICIDIKHLIFMLCPKLISMLQDAPALQ